MIKYLFLGLVVYIAYRFWIVKPQIPSKFEDQEKSEKFTDYEEID